MSYPWHTNARHTSRTPRARCKTHNNTLLHKTAAGSSQGRPGPLGSAAALAAWLCCLLTQRSTYPLNCSTNALVAIPGVAMVVYIYDCSFLILDCFVSQKVVSSLDVDLATLSLLVRPFSISLNQCLYPSPEQLCKHAL